MGQSPLRKSGHWLMFFLHFLPPLPTTTAAALSLKSDLMLRVTLGDAVMTEYHRDVTLNIQFPSTPPVRDQRARYMNRTYRREREDESLLL